jgi:hypothetical protein
MLKNTSVPIPAPHEQILAITMGFWQSRALAVAVLIGPMITDSSEL